MNIEDFSKKIEDIVADLYEFLCGNEVQFGASEIGVSVENHMIGFAAEESRHNKTVVDIDEFCARKGLKAGATL
jgi:hypothetical protein